MTDQQLKAWELTLQAKRDDFTARKYASELAEMYRHNLAYETETQRHNRATEEAALQQIGVAWHQAQSGRISAEANRRNVDVNMYNAETNRYNADTNRQNAFVNQWNAAINERNAATNERNAATNERNAQSNAFNAETNRMALGPQWLSAQASYAHSQAAMTSAEAALRNAEYNYALGQLNYGLGQFRAETERYGTIMNATSNRMSARANTRNAETRYLEYGLAARNAEQQRALWLAQTEHQRLLTDIQQQWGYQQAKASAYKDMASAMYSSRQAEFVNMNWASSTALGIVGAATKFPYGTKYNPDVFKGINFLDESSGVQYLQP